MTSSLAALRGFHLSCGNFKGSPTFLPKRPEALWGLLLLLLPEAPGLCLEPTLSRLNQGPVHTCDGLDVSASAQMCTAACKLECA